MKTVLILVDGMRPDSLTMLPKAQKMMAESSYALDAQTVFPSVTLPCHMSLFHSVEPTRHGVTTNTFTPQVRPIAGLCDVLHWAAGKKCAFFYNWEQLRDVALAGSLTYSCCICGGTEGWEKTNRYLTDAAIDYIQKNSPDFTFLYLGWADEAGHEEGWMGEEYLRSVKISWDEIYDVIDSLPEDYSVIVTADHGGHDRMHGTAEKEDMTIPAFFRGAPFEAGRVLGNLSIMDIAPTLAKLLEVNPAPEWEGKSII